MPGFRYQAYNVDGKLHKGVLEADSARQARAQLREQGLTPYRVEVIAANDPAAGARFRPVALSSTQLTQLTRSLASLLEAGLTVEQAFNALIEQAESERVRQVLAALRGEVIAGNTIAKALGAFPRVFSDLYRTLVAAGESSGQLPRVLGKLADYLEERHALRARLTLALRGPGPCVAGRGGGRGRHAAPAEARTALDRRARRARGNAARPRPRGDARVSARDGASHRERRNQRPPRRGARARRAAAAGG